MISRIINKLLFSFIPVYVTTRRVFFPIMIYERLKPDLLVGKDNNREVKNREYDNNELN